MAEGPYRISESTSTSYECDERSERLCVIINNKTFGGERFRHGSDEDAAGLIRLFRSHLGFTVDSYEDKSAKEMKDLMKGLKHRRNISRFSCIVNVILSHGCSEEIEGSDNKTVALKDITQYLDDKNCPPLKGKPKVFIVQACRGSDVNDPISEIEVSTDTVGLVASSTYTGGVSQDGTDMLIAFATIPDHAAHRNPTQGSLFIQKFIEVMRQRAHDTHLVEILLQVNRDVSHEGMQMPSIVVQLRAHLYLRPRPLLTVGEMQQLGDSLKEAVANWQPVRAETITTLTEILENLQKMNRDVRISRIVGASTSIVGGIVAIVGFGLIPVTFGASLALTIVGATIGVAGGATSAGATIADMVKTKTGIKKAQEIIKADQKMTAEINDILEEMAREIERMQYKNHSYSPTNILALMLRGGQGIGYIGSLVAKFTVEGLEIARVGAVAGLRLAGAGGVAIAGGVVSALLIPVDIADIAFNATKLHKKSDSNATKWLSEHVDQLEQQRDEIMNALPPPDQQRDENMNALPPPDQLEQQRDENMNALPPPDQLEQQRDEITNALPPPE